MTTTTLPPTDTAGDPAPTPRAATAIDTRRVGLRDATRGEWIKFRSVRSTVVTLLAAALVTVGLGVLFSSLAETGTAAPPGPGGLGDPIETAPVITALAGADLAGMIVGVLGVLAVAGEYATGLITTTIAAVRRRTSVLWGKVLVVGAATATVMGLAVTLAAWLGQAAYTGDGTTLALTDPDVIQLLIGTTVYVTAIALIGVALGFLLRSTGAAIGALVGGLFIGPPLLNLLPDSVADVVVPYLPSSAGDVITSLTPSADLLGTGESYAVLAAWVVGLLVAASVKLRRQDA